MRIANTRCVLEGPGRMYFVAAVTLAACCAALGAQDTTPPGPQPPQGAPEYEAPSRPTDGANMALTVEKLTRGFDPPRPLLIWSIGCSFTLCLGDEDQRQLEHAVLIDGIRQRFPDAPQIVYKKMTGGSTPFRLLRGWARHLVIPEQPDVVLIYNFGETAELEKLIVDLRTHTTADIIVPTLHWCQGHPWPDPEARNRHLDPIGLREVCARHGVEFVENRRELTEYMIAHGLEIEDLLYDDVHQIPYAAKMTNANIARHFNRAARPAYDPRSRERRIEAEAPSPALSRSDDWRIGKDGQALVASGKWTRLKGPPDILVDAGTRSSIEVQFTGTRIDLVGWRDPQGGSASVMIDGKPAQEAPVYYATYVRPAPSNSWATISNLCDGAPHGIALGEEIVPQRWTISMTSDKGDYELVGSATGFDGKGNAFKPFASQSGQIMIEPDLWRFAKHMRTGDRFTFDVYRCAKGQIDFAGPAEKFRSRLVENLPPGRHTLRLETRGGGRVIVDAFDVFEPPEKASK